MTDETYNGWANRETWAFNLHWQNEESTYYMVLGWAQDLLVESSGLSDRGLGERIIGLYEDYLDDQAHEEGPYAFGVLSDIGSFWRIDAEETGKCVRESLEDQ